jgi:hypothetical protein
MRRFSGPITIERVVDMFINLFVWRLVMMAVDKTIRFLFTGVQKVFSRPKDPTLLPPQTPVPSEPQLRDFSRPRDNQPS